MMQIPMSKEILGVIFAVKSYKDYVYADSVVRGYTLDTDDSVKKYYYSLPLPEGMLKNWDDYNSVLQLGGSKLYSEMMNTNFAELGKYNWKNF